MNIGIFNTRGINQTEHFIPLELEELKRLGHTVEIYWTKGRHPTKKEAECMDFAIFHFVPTAMFFSRIGVPFCVLPTANDIFPNEGENLIYIQNHPNCKFVGYQSFYHKRKYDEWGITKPIAHIPHCVRTKLFKRQTPYNPSGKIIAGGRLIPKKGLDRLKGVENLTIFGDGPLIDKLGQELGASTKFTGYMGAQSLKELFEEASIYLFPAIVMPDGDSEGISNTIKESMLMELQVICTPIAGNTEFENIAFLSDWSKESVERAINSVSKEPNTKGRAEILKTFSPEICVNKLLKAIDDYN